MKRHGTDALGLLDLGRESMAYVREKKVRHKWGEGGGVCGGDPEEYVREDSEEGLRTMGENRNKGVVVKEERAWWL